MLFAVDCNDNRVHIDDTYSNQEYYCPYCGAPLTTKKRRDSSASFCPQAESLVF